MAFFLYELASDLHGFWNRGNDEVEVVDGPGGEIRYIVFNFATNPYGTDTEEKPQVRACLRGRSYRARLYSPERLLYPMKRVGARGEATVDDLASGPHAERAYARALGILDATDRIPAVTHRGDRVEGLALS